MKFTIVNPTFHAGPPRDYVRPRPAPRDSWGTVIGGICALVGAIAWTALFLVVTP